MLRTIFVTIIFATGAFYALKGPFYALLLYLWIAYFRPELWVWTDFIQQLNLSFGAGVYLVLRSVIGGAPFRIDFRIGLLFAYLAQATLSLFFSPYFDFAWPYWKEFAKVTVVTYLIAILADDRAKFRTVLFVIALSLGFEAVKQGWAQLILNPGGQNANGIAFLGDNNFVAPAMCMFLPVLLALAETARSKWERRGFYFAAIGVFYRAISTYSRAGFLSCGALAAVLLFRSPHRARALFVTGMAAILILPVLPQAFWDRMATIAAPAEERDASAAGRIHFWKVAVIMANDRPFTGVGHNAFIPAYGQYDPSRGASFGSGRSVHSTWFGALAELGYPGLALLLVNLALAVRACSRVRKLARRGEIPEDLGKFATALESSFVPFAVGGTFVVFQYNEMVWHYIGLTIALDAIAREEARAAPSPAAAPAAPALAGAKGTP